VLSFFHVCKYLYYGGIKAIYIYRAKKHTTVAYFLGRRTDHAV